MHPKEVLLKLATERKSCQVCSAYSPGLIENGSNYPFDPYVLSHWSQWLGSSSPELLIVGQDFGNLSYFKRFEGRDDPGNETNIQLHAFLRKAGFETSKPPHCDDGSNVFLTNSVLCFKTAEEMNAQIKPHWARNCTTLYFLPLVEALKPKAVVAMGSPAWKAIRKLFKLHRSPEPILKASGSQWNAQSTQIFPVAHCGRLGQRNRAYELQVQDWERIGSFLGKR